jgi:hypothetical protein
MLLQPRFYDGMRSYAAFLDSRSLDVMVLTPPVALLDLALPLAFVFVAQAVFAWVPTTYVLQHSEPLGTFLSSAGGSAGVIVVQDDDTEDFVWLGVFKSPAIKARLFKLSSE